MTSREQEQRTIISKLLNLWRRFPGMSLEKMLRNIDSAFLREANALYRVSDEDFEWALDHFDDDPPENENYN